jgi:hypothetical protein
VGAYPGGDAMRLLRAINAYQAHDRVGAIVLPCAVASAAGLDPAFERYEEALWALLVGGAGGERSRAAGGGGEVALRPGAVQARPGGRAHAGEGVTSYSTGPEKGRSPNSGRGGF